MKRLVLCLVVLILFCQSLYAVTIPESLKNTKIAFTAGGIVGNVDIYIMDADGRNQTRLTYHPAGDSNPSWSPDGTKIAFGSKRDVSGDLYVMNADGTNIKRVTTNPAVDEWPVWSPFLQVSDTPRLFVSVKEPVGQEVVAEVRVEGISDLFGYQFDLHFDPKILKAVTVDEGDFLKGNGGTTFWKPPEIENNAGEITGLLNSRLTPGAELGSHRLHAPCGDASTDAA